MSTTVRRQSPSVRDGLPVSAKAVLCAWTGGIPPQHELAVGNASLPRGQWRPQGRQSTCPITPLAAVLLAASQEPARRLQYVPQRRKHLRRSRHRQDAAAGGPSPDGGLDPLAKAQPEAERLPRQECVRTTAHCYWQPTTLEEADDLSGADAYALSRTSGLRMGA